MFYRTLLRRYFGCVESAVMGGMQVSMALTGYPRPQDIIGYPYKD